MSVSQVAKQSSVENVCCAWWRWWYPDMLEKQMQEQCQNEPTRRSSCKIKGTSSYHIANQSADLFSLAVRNHARDIPTKDLCRSLQCVHHCIVQVLINAEQQICRAWRAASITG